MKKIILREWAWINTIGVRHPETEEMWEWAERKGTGQVVSALVENTSRETFVLVEQFRPLLDAQVIELVAGLVDVWNTPEEAIAKEILEETGYVAEHIDFLLAWPKSAGITTEQTKEYYAQVSGTPGKQMLEPSEAGLIVHETQNTSRDLDKFLAAEEKLGKLVSPGIWAAVWMSLAQGKIAL